MDLTRRGFLGACLVLGVAPAVVRASSLMPIRVNDGMRFVVLPNYGIHFDKSIYVGFGDTLILEAPGKRIDIPYQCLPKSGLYTPEDLKALWLSRD